jgi:hypothetical protein
MRIQSRCEVSREPSTAQKSTARLVAPITLGTHLSTKFRPFAELGPPSILLPKLRAGCFSFLPRQIVTYISDGTWTVVDLGRVHHPHWRPRARESV